MAGYIFFFYLLPRKITIKFVFKMFISPTVNFKFQIMVDEYIVKYWPATLTVSIFRIYLKDKDLAQTVEQHGFDSQGM